MSARILPFPVTYRMKYRLQAQRRRAARSHWTREDRLINETIQTLLAYEERNNNGKKNK